MGSFAILQPGAIAASNTDSLLKFAKYTLSAVENGNVLTLGALSTVSGEHEVFVAATPATASLDTAIYYMVSEPAIVVTNAQFKGLSDDPTDFNIPASAVFTVFKPKVGDEIIMSADGISGSVNTYAVPANNALELAFSASASGVSLVWEVIETTFVTVPSSNFYTGHKVAYKLRCIVAQ